MCMCVSISMSFVYISTVTGGCELPNMGGYWKQNSGPLQEEQGLITTEPSLRSHPYQKDKTKTRNLLSK